MLFDIYIKKDGIEFNFGILNHLVYLIKNDNKE